ncbi:class I SAM-dependent methyltransferase [Pseudophaeobacter sp.]|uniref:class I SAM-dependent methyltransferase n=1 Tax=Pseudophaeobacter sp. TaxID=1971739 RepID=UPI0040585AD5
MAEFVKRMNLNGGERVIDLGGTPEFWADCPVPLDITVMNLPGFNAPKQTAKNITLCEGDACGTGFADQSFDIAFSNSVIEHVGDESKQQQMAHEARRLAPAYWVQTPSIWFPIEAHNHMPFWWFYPARLQQHFIRNWRKKLPEWTKMVETTRVLLRSSLRRLFPDGEIWTERKFGFPKSYVLYKRPPGHQASGLRQPLFEGRQ